MDFASLSYSLAIGRKAAPKGATAFSWEMALIKHLCAVLKIVILFILILFPADFS